MDSEVQNLLYLIAEIAIGTVALSGITMVLLVSNRKVSRQQTGQIAAQLSMAFVVVVFSIFPLMTTRFALSPEDGWLVCSGSYLLVILLFQLGRFIGRSPLAGVKGFVGLIVTFPAVTAFILLGVNFWLRTDWPYLVQLFLALITSMILYLAFVYSALSETGNSENE